MLQYFSRGICAHHHNTLLASVLPPFFGFSEFGAFWAIRIEALATSMCCVVEVVLMVAETLFGLVGFGCSLVDTVVMSTEPLRRRHDTEQGLLATEPTRSVP